MHSLAQDAIGAPAIKAGLINLLSGQPAPTGGISVRWWAVIISLITLVSVGLEGRGLWRLPRWRQQAATQPVWRPLLTILWSFVPAGLVLAMPALVLQSAGRAFGYLTLFRSMIGVMSWLILCGVLGVLNGLARLVWLLRRRTPAS